MYIQAILKKLKQNILHSFYNQINKLDIIKKKKIMQNFTKLNSLQIEGIH